MRNAMGAVLCLLICMGAGCGERTPQEPAAGPGSEVSRALFVGTWDFVMKWPSGDEMAMVRVLKEDGTAEQFDKESGESSTGQLRWRLSDDKTALELLVHDMLVSRYEIIAAEEGRHVLKNAHGLEETCTRR